MSSTERERTTTLLRRAGAGDEEASEPLFDSVYESLRSLAGSYLNGAARSHTLQPTALVHEAYLRMLDVTTTTARDEQHFLAVAATAMKQILIDHARAKKAEKRDGGHQRVTLSGLGADPSNHVDLLDLDAALSRLRERSDRQTRVVELRFFGGLTVEQCAQVLGVSERTIESDWRTARAWLHAVLVRGVSL